MPWRETSPMEERLAFVREFATELFTMSELAVHYGISRKTGYKWVERYTAGGVMGLCDRSRRPHTSPLATDPELVAALVALRRRHPLWGAKKLLGIVRRAAPPRTWPAPSTVAALLKRGGLVVPRRRAPRLRAVPTVLTVPTRSNEVWTTDFKGEFRTGDGVYCYPLTVRDGCSRLVIRCDGLRDRATGATRRGFERAFAEYGLPERIRSDNGGPFASAGLGGLTALSVWWMRLGIIPERIAAGHPEQNGAHEHFHGVLKAHTARPPAPNLRAQQQRFRRFVREYNEERPHEALADQTPASCYQRSPRVLPGRLPPLEYPSHLEVRRVSDTGKVSWAGTPLFLSAALATEQVAFEEVDDGLWTVYFASVALARLDARRRVIHPLAARSGGRSASGAGSAPDLKTKKEKEHA